MSIIVLCLYNMYHRIVSCKGLVGYNSATVVLGVSEYLEPLLTPRKSNCYGWSQFLQSCTNQHCYMYIEAFGTLLYSHTSLILYRNIQYFFFILESTNAILWSYSPLEVLPLGENIYITYCHTECLWLCCTEQ